MSTHNSIDGKSLDTLGEIKQQLQNFLPDVFTEGKIDFKRLREALGEEVNNQNEYYELSWAGKAEARREVQRQTTATLVPDRDGSINFDNSEHIFIEGENLEVLRVLQKSYFGKVKTIYIDPPYNTGNDSFVYPDDYSERLDEHNRRIDEVDKNGFLNKRDLWKKNNREGAFHSTWLSMMYPRMYMARNLLKEDGVVFVSIDDNEVAALKLLLNEIFGEENLVSTIVWQRTFASKNDAKFFSTEHEYLLVYAKNLQMFSLNLLDRTEKQNIRYSNPDNDYRGEWTSTDLLRMEHRENSVYEITSPSGKVWKPQQGTSWRHPEKEMLELIANNEVTFGPLGDAKPRRKRFLQDVKQGIVSQTIWKHDEVGHTQEAKQLLNKIFNGLPTLETPKPVRLIERCLQLTTSKNSSDIILDFFGGSSTTAQAVIESNLKDGGNRKFILVQFPEPLEDDSASYREGYRSVADIGRMRIQKVVEQIKGESDNKKVGFRSYKLAPSNFKAWQADTRGEQSILQQLEMFQSSEIDGSTNENMLCELLLKTGLPLTTNVHKIKISNQSIYSVDEGRLLMFFDSYNEQVKETILQSQPQQVICLDRVFMGNDEALTNFKLALTESNVALTII